MVTLQVKEKDVHNILAWEEKHKDVAGVEVPFRPARVILQVGFNVLLTGRYYTLLVKCFENDHGLWRVSWGFVSN